MRIISEESASQHPAVRTIDEDDSYNSSQYVENVRDNGEN